MRVDPPKMDHLNSNVGNTANAYKSRVESNYKLYYKVISFINYPRKHYIKIEIANDKNKQGYKSGCFAIQLNVTQIEKESQTIIRNLLQK